MLEILKITGAILGILAFLWKLRDAYATYLHINLEIDSEVDGGHKARTIVENKGVFSKRVDNALLLIGPEHESPIDTVNSMKKLGVTIQSTNEIATICPDETVIGNGGRMLIPLPFYYSENVTISDEILRYTAPIPCSTLISEENYSVRLFLYTTGRLHRSTHACFTAPTTTEQNAAEQPASRSAVTNK